MRTTTRRNESTGSSGRGLASAKGSEWRPAVEKKRRGGRSGWKNLGKSDQGGARSRVRVKGGKNRVRCSPEMANRQREGGDELGVRKNEGGSVGLQEKEVEREERGSVAEVMARWE